MAADLPRTDRDDITIRGWSAWRIVRLLARGRGIPLAAAVGAGFILFQITLAAPHWQPVRNLVFDAFQRNFPRKAERFPAIIIDIDDASLRSFGQWPWPRTRIAALIQKTLEYGALVVGLDFIMPESDRLSPDNFARERLDIDPELRERLLSLPSNDEILAQILKRTPTVIGRAGLIDGPKPDESTGWHTPVMTKEGVSLTGLYPFQGHLANIPVLEDAAVGRGYLNATRDEDGVVRTAPLVVTVNGKPAPTLALELLRVATGENWYTIAGDRDGLTGIQLGQFFIPTNPDGRIRQYYSPENSKRRVSAGDVLNGKLEADALADQVAVIGVSGLGLVDTAATPVTPLMDGTEIHIQVIENINDGSRLIRPAWARWVEPACLLAAALALVLTTLGGSIRYGLIAFLIITALMPSAALFGFVRHRLLFDPSLPMAGSAAMLMVLLITRYAAVDFRKRELKAALEAEKLLGIRLAGELDAARSIQMGILPDPKHIPGLPKHIDFHAFLEPAGMVGGDLYDALMIDPDHFFFLIGDVSGKGIPASMFMALSKTLTKSVALRKGSPLDELVISANDEISRENPAGLFITAVACILDVHTGELEFCIAGHDSPLLLRTGEPPRPLDSEGGPPLCIFEDFPYPSTAVRLSPGDTVVLITDGITEAHNTENELYGFARARSFLAAIENHLNKEKMTSEAVCLALHEDVVAFTRGAPTFDDMAIMAVRYLPPEEPNES